MSRVVSLVVLAGCFSTPARPFGDGGAPSDAVDGPVSDARDGPPNVMFVSKTRSAGSSLAQAGAADAVCRSEAADAQLPDPDGFVAWFSDLLLNRNAGALLAGSSGWVRADGMPFANTVTDIAAGRLFYPPRLDADGTDRFVASQFIATGTGRDGTATIQCSTGEVTVGVNDAAAPEWTDIFTSDCATLLQVYCFGTGRSADVTPSVPSGERLAFVSTATDYSDISNLDGVCGADATEAGLPGTYRALVALTTMTARDRITNTTGKSWYRPDGVRVSGPTINAFEAPLDVDAKGNYIDGGVGFGAADPKTLALSSENCSDWTVTSPGGMTNLGRAIRSSPMAFKGYALLPCGDFQRVYCFQTDP